jgi:hypothetical protein
VYAYVTGQLLRNTDPLGLNDDDSKPLGCGNPGDPYRHGRILIHQAGADDFDRTERAAAQSRGRYEVTENNWYADSDEILEGLRDAEKGDVFVFQGHSVSKPTGEVVGIKGQDWIGDGVITTSQLRSAARTGHQPAAIILAACDTEQMLQTMSDAAGVTYGMTGRITEPASRGAADTIAAALAEGKTIAEAAEAANRYLDGVNPIARGRASDGTASRVVFVTRDDIDEDKSLADNGLSDATLKTKAGGQASMPSGATIGGPEQGEQVE